MSKERLEEIKKLYNFWMKEDGSIGLLPEDIEWLIEQAERVEELITILEDRNIRLDYLEDVYKKIIKQNECYCEAVEELIDSWKDNVKSTKQHNESDYSIYREGLIEALQFAIDNLENALEESE